MIRSALEMITSVDPAGLSGEELAMAVLSTEQLLNAVHALSAVLLERSERDGRWAIDGALSATAWTARTKPWAAPAPA